VRRACFRTIDTRGGQYVHGPPAQIKVWFTERLEPAFSTVRVSDRSGKQVDSGDAQLDPADARLLQVSLPKLARAPTRLPGACYRSTPM
jgi:methionine-rich copper-binding protein CopC